MCSKMLDDAIDDKLSVYGHGITLAANMKLK